MVGIEPAAVLHGPGDLRLESRRVSEPREHEVLVRVSAVGICGSDVHYFEDGCVGPNVVRAPHILGHEVCGRIVARGERATRHAVGTRVVLEPGVSCGTCSECTSGLYNLCSEVRFLGAPPVDGALRRHVAIDQERVFPLPETISDEAGALIEPLAVALWACQRAGLKGDERLLITGAGPIGLLTAAVARTLGIDKVSVVDINEQRLGLARRLGLAEGLTPEELSGALRADVLIECSGSPDALESALIAVRPAGCVVIVGMPAEGTVSFALDHLQRRELTAIGSFRYAGCFPEAIELAASGSVPLEAIITSRYPLQETERALTAAQRDPAQVKSLVLVA